jgi:hypothetical protein
MMPTNLRASVPYDSPRCPTSTAAYCATVPRPPSRLCRRYSDGRCQMGQRPPCPFGGRGDGYCSWHSVEVEVNVEAETETTIQPPIESRSGRLCECGATLGPHRKLCDPCRTEARRETMRVSQARWRVRVAERNAHRRTTA